MARGEDSADKVAEGWADLVQQDRAVLAYVRNVDTKSRMKQAFLVRKRSVLSAGR